VLWRIDGIIAPLGPSLECRRRIGVDSWSVAIDRNDIERNYTDVYEPGKYNQGQRQFKPQTYGHIRPEYIGKQQGKICGEDDQAYGEDETHNLEISLAPSPRRIARECFWQSSDRKEEGRCCQ